MSEFNLWFANTTSTNIRVDADNLEQAEEIASDELPGSLCNQCSRQRDDGEWELSSIEDAEGNVLRTYPDFNLGNTAAALAKHIAETVTQGEGNDVVVDCACGVEVRGVLPDVDSPTGAIMAVMAPHLAEVAASHLA